MERREEELAVEAGAVSPTRSSSTGGSPKPVFVGDVNDAHSDNLSLGSILDDDYSHVADASNDAGHNISNTRFEDSMIGDAKIEAIERLKAPLNERALPIHVQARKEESSSQGSDDSKNLSLGNLLDDDQDVVADFPIDVGNERSGGKEVDLVIETDIEDSMIGDAKVEAIGRSKAPLNERALPVHIQARKEESSSGRSDDSENISLGSLLDDDRDVVADFPIDVGNKKPGGKEVDLVIETDIFEQDLCQEKHLHTSLEVKVDDAGGKLQPHQTEYDKDEHHPYDDKDNIDSDGLSGANSDMSYTVKIAVIDDTKRKDEIDSGSQLNQAKTMIKENREAKSGDVCIQSAVSHDGESTNASVLSTDTGTTNSSNNIDEEQIGHKNCDNQIQKEELQINDVEKCKLSLDQNIGSVDEIALELDALLDDSDREGDDMNVDFEVIEEPPNQETSNIRNRFMAKTSDNGRKTISNFSNGGRSMLFAPTNKIRNVKIEKHNNGEKSMQARSEGAGKRFMEGKLQFTSSMSDKLSSSKKKMLTARDRMRDYSREVSSRASSQMGGGEKDTSTNSVSLRLSGTKKRLFVTPAKNTLSCNSEVAEKEKRSKPLWGTHLNDKGFAHYMKSTVTFTNKVLEKKIIQEHRTKLKEFNAKKIITSTTSWRKKKNPSMNTNAGANYKLNARSYAGQSVSSFSSQCTVESFINPRKAGITGCQNEFDPYLFQTRGACELCIFRLPEVEKQKLDTQGRHLMVQFTTGGCRDCCAFSQTNRDSQVRLCHKCYASSHRKVEIRCRKKGCGSDIGYSFAKVSKGTFQNLINRI